MFTNEEWETLIIRAAFLATALAYYLGYRLHVWASGRRYKEPTPAGIPVVYQMSNGIPPPPAWTDTPAKFLPEPVFEDEPGVFDKWEYVKPEGPNWPGSDNVTLNPRKYS